MNQNDYIALGLSALVVGGLAVFGKKLAPAPDRDPPRPLPPFPPQPTPGPGGDPQYDAAKRAIEAVVAGLQAQQGGMTQAQRDQAAAALDMQATTLEASGQSSPAAVALLRNAAQQLRAGQLPNVPPSPNPSPSPSPSPFPFPFPFPTTTTPASPTPATPGTPNAELLQARAAIRRAEGEIAANPKSREEVASLLASSSAAYKDPAAVSELRNAAVRLVGGTLPSTGQAAASSSSTSPPSTPENLTARYKEMRDHCADYLQGARTIDAAALGAADRTTTDLLRAGDMNRSADLGALANASYARAGIVRPVAVTP